MKLVLLRHARAQADAPAGDFARTLTSQGREDAASTGAKLLDLGIRGAAVLASPSARTTETFELLPEAISSGDAKMMQSLYNADVSDVLSGVAEAGEQAIVIVLGHNPSLSAAALHLTAGDAQFDGVLRPADAIVLELDTLEAGAARVEAVVRPDRQEDGR